MSKTIYFSRLLIFIVMVVISILYGHPRQSLLLWNDSKGGFTASLQIGPARSSTRMAAAADLNGNGLIDLIVGGPEALGIEKCHLV